MNANLAQIPVIILAGGLGTRLRPVLPDRPKGLAPIGERSFLEVQIGLLSKQGARKFILCVGYEAHKIQESFGDGRRLGVHIDYAIETKLLGTAGALKNAGPKLAARALVLNGDTYLDIDYTRLLEYHLQVAATQDALATLVLCRTDDRSRYGTVVFDMAQQKVTGFFEKSRTVAVEDSFVSAGVYVIEKRVLDWIPENTVYSIEKELFPSLIESDEFISAYITDKSFLDIGTPEGWNELLRHLSISPRVQKA